MKRGTEGIGDFGDIVRKEQGRPESIRDSYLAGPPSVDSTSRSTALGGVPANQSLASWLESHPEAMVGAVSPNGAPLEMPASIPLSPEHQVDTRSFLELVIPEDSRTVTDAFVTALARGIGVARIHMSSDPANALLLHYLDLREEHGVMLRAVTSGDELDEDPKGPIRVTEIQPTRPRLGRMIKNETASIVSVDRATTLMLGWTTSELIGHSTLDFVHPDDHVRAIDNWMSRLTGEHGHSIQSARLRYVCKDGSWLWLETSNDFQLQDDGTSIVVAQLLDVSEEMAAVEALRHNEQFLRRLTDTVPVGLIHIAGDNTVVFVNPVFRNLIGDVPIRALSDLTTAMSTEGPRLEAAITSVMMNGLDADLELTLSMDNGRSRAVRITLRLVDSKDRGLGVLGCMVDVTDLRRMADTDVLTGLRNRRSLLGDLDDELIRHSGKVSVIFADLDRFKLVNDQYGHQAGDQVLAAVAERFRSAIRPGDLIGRLGGDEFIVVCPGVSAPRPAMVVARRLQKSLTREFTLPGISVHIVASFGIACGTPEVTADELISSSDSAMYESKHANGGDLTLASARTFGSIR
jgi:diguanylate cyclase (GGDEF)-like protein/PAS domain S-box-containing protein